MNSPTKDMRLGTRHPDDSRSTRPIVEVGRIQQLIEDVYSEGWYTQAEEFQHLLDAYKELLTKSHIGLDTL